MQAKYRKNVVDIVLCNVFAPQKPVATTNNNNNNVMKNEIQ